MTAHPPETNPVQNRTETARNKTMSAMSTLSTRCCLFMNAIRSLPEQVAPDHRQCLAVQRPSGLLLLLAVFDDSSSCCSRAAGGSNGSAAGATAAAFQPSSNELDSDRRLIRSQMMVVKVATQRKHLAGSDAYQSWYTTSVF